MKSTDKVLGDPNMFFSLMECYCCRVTKNSEESVIGRDKDRFHRRDNGTNSNSMNTGSNKSNIENICSSSNKTDISSSIVNNNGNKGTVGENDYYII